MVTGPVSCILDKIISNYLLDMININIVVMKLYINTRILSIATLIFQSSRFSNSIWKSIMRIQAEYNTGMIMAVPISNSQ